MLVRKIKYDDLMGNEREKECYFHLNKAEVIQWLTSTGEATLDKVLERIIKERNGRKIMDTFDDLLRRSYGEPSVDGDLFVKDEEVWKKFRYSEAYSTIFTELVTDAKKAAEFVNGVVPKDLAEAVKKAMNENPDQLPTEIRDYFPKEE